MDNPDGPSKEIKDVGIRQLTDSFYPCLFCYDGVNGEHKKMKTWGIIRLGYISEQLIFYEEEHFCERHGIYLTERSYNFTKEEIADIIKTTDGVLRYVEYR